MDPQSTVIEVPASEQTTVTCGQCHTTTSVYKVPNSAPHLYCTKCQNVYHETRQGSYESRFPFASFRKKIMHHIEGNAPICPCGGLFIFNALPRNPTCLHEISLSVKMEGKARLLYDEMYVFDNTKEFTDGGPTRLYRFIK